MGKNSAIEWTDHTFNPWWGCTKVDVSCANCYAEKIAARFGHDCGGDNPRRLFGAKHWREPMCWDRAAKKAGRQDKVFCGSMCDVFERHAKPDYNKAVLAQERAKLWDLIDDTSDLIWLLLTKRPENIFRMLPDHWLMDGLPRNVWFGTSAGTQDELDERWPVLDSETHHLNPAVLFLSLEPLLESVDLAGALEEINVGDEEHDWWTRPPDWVIVGAESGPGRRPFDAAWAEKVYRQCCAAGIPFFGKQDGGPRPGVPLFVNGLQIKEFPQ